MASGDTEADLGYLQRLKLYEDEKPFQIFIPIEDGQRQSNLEFEAISQKIVDIRPNIETFRLDDQGFEVRECPTALSFESFQDEEQIKSRYLPEIEKELRSVDGGHDRVFFFRLACTLSRRPILTPSERELDTTDTCGSSQIRTSDSSKHDRENKIVDINARVAWLDPVTRVHVDQSPRSVVHRVHLQLGEDSAFLLKGRVRIINAWRPLRRPVEEWPLALCDSSSMPQQDLVECDHVRRRFKGSAFYAYHNPNHKWYYLSRQRPEEVMFLKIFDSDVAVKSKSCPHTSFQHPDSPKDCPARESIEVRALVFNYPDGMKPPAGAQNGGEIVSYSRLEETTAEAISV